MKRSYKYRIYPNGRQKKIINDNLYFCCFLYNCALEERKSFFNKYYKKNSKNKFIKEDTSKKDISYYLQAGKLKEIKEEFSEKTKTIYSQSLQSVLKRIDIVSKTTI